MTRRSQSFPAVCVLAADQSSKNSGVALGIRPRPCLPAELVMVEEVRTVQHRLEVVRFAVRKARSEGVPLVAVFEDHSGVPLSAGTKYKMNRGKDRPDRNTRVVLGMGDARGRFREQVELHGIRHTMVQPSIFRPKVLGISKYTPTEAAKREACDWARRKFGVNQGHDVGEATAIMWWGLHSPEVWELAKMRPRCPLVGLA